MEVYANGRASSTRNSNSSALGLISILSLSWVESRTMTWVDMRSPSSQKLFIRCLPYARHTVNRKLQEPVPGLSKKDQKVMANNSGSLKGRWVWTRQENQ